MSITPELQSALKLLDAEPGNADAFSALSAAIGGDDDGTSDPAKVRALDEARRVHRDRGDFELVVRLLDAELAAVKDAGRRAHLLAEKARVLVDDLCEEAAAEAAWNEVLAHNPDDEAAKDALAQIALVRDNWEKVLAKYESEAKSATDRMLAASLHLSIAELHLKRELDANAVEQHLRRTLELDPKNKRAVGHFERYLRKAGRLADLAAFYEHRETAPGVTKDDKLAALLALAEVQQKLGRNDLAVEALRKVLAIDANHPRAFKAAVAALTDEGDWSQLVKVYELVLKAKRGPDTAETLELVGQLGELLWQRLGNDEAAEPHYGRIRKSHPAHPAALDFYRAFHGDRNEGGKLLQVLQAAQKAEPDPDKRYALAVETAEVAERSAGSVDKAIEIWKGIARSEPGRTEATEALKRLYTSSGKWNAMLELLKEQAEKVPLPTEPGPARDEAIERRIGFLGEVVAIYRDKLNLPVMVINTYNAMLALRPDHEGALTALAQKYEEVGRWNDLINVLQRTADAQPDGEAGRAKRAALLRRIAGLWIDRFANHNNAVKPLEELYAIAPDDAEAAARLRDIYTKRRGWRQLLDLERKELARIADGTARRARLIDMAKLAAEKLGDPREAIGLWNQLLEEDPSDDAALAALAALYDREKRFPALVEILRRQRLLLADPKAQVALLEKIGVLAAEKLQAPRLAVEAYREILRVQPNHPKAMRLLRELLVSTGDFAGLEQLYADHGTWEELCDTLLQVAERHADPAVKLRLNTRAAELSLEKLQQPERAVKAYERILVADPQNKAAAEALSPLYRRAEKWSRLLAMFEIRIGHAETDDERFDLYREVADLCEHRLGNRRQAFDWTEKAYRLRPDDLALEADLVRLAREADSHDELAAILAEQLEKCEEGDRKIQRLRQLADLVLGKLGRAEEARRYYEAILERVPGDLPSLDALERIHATQGDHVELLKVLRLRLQVVPDSTARVELLYRIAWIEEEQASDLDAAALTYQSVLEEEPHAARALRSLERIYTARENFPKLAEIVQRQLEAVDGGQEGAAETEAQLSYRLGEIHEVHLKQPADALPYYVRAFERAPGSRDTLTALERYLAEGNPARVDVAKLLEPVYERGEEVEKQVGALRILLDAASGEDEQLQLLRTLTRLTGRRLGDAEAAYGYASRIFEMVPSDEDVRRELAELGDVLDCHRDLAGRVAAAESRVADSDPVLARDLAWELGVLFEERLKDEAAAEQAYLRVLSRDESHEAALRALERLYKNAGRFGELRALLLRRTELASTDADRRELLFQIAALDEQQLRDPKAACGVYLQILDIDPTPGPGTTRAFEALERIYTAEQAWRDLDALYERTVQNVESNGGRAALKFKRGKLALERLADPVAACDFFEEALAEDARNEDARDGLEKLLENAELRLRAAKLLEPLHINDENYPKLVSVLEAQREKAEGRDAVELLSRVAQLAEERLADPDKAFAAWREAFLLDSVDEGVAAQMERLALGLDRHRDLAEAWQKGEAGVDPHDLALRRLFTERAARLYDEPLADTAKAKAAWRHLLDLDQNNLETARPAAEALARIHQGEEAWNDLVAVLRLQAGWAETDPVDDKDKKHFLRQVATVQEDLLQDYGAAVATHREILDLDPEDRPALDGLERLHDAQEQWPELIEVLRRRLDQSNEPAARRGHLWRIAELTEKKLTPAEGPLDDAIAAYAALLDEQPEDVPALDTLARLYARAERHADLLDVLERRLAIAVADGTMVERQTLREKIAALHAGPLAQPAAALDRWREMLQEDPDNEPGRKGLEGLLGDEDLRLTAAEVLEPVYECRGETDRVIALCELWAEHAPDLHERVSRLRTIASLKERGGEARAGFEALARAARLAVAEAELPSLLVELERLVAMQGVPDPKGLAGDLVTLYRELGPDILDAEVQERVYLTIAARSNEMGDRDTAREYYRLVLDAQPEHTGALDALEDLYREGEEWEPLLEIYTRRADLAGADADARRRYLGRAAALCRGPLTRPDDAIGFYEQILEIEPGDATAAEHLDELLRRAGRFADLADLLERRLGFAAEVDDAVRLRVRLGGLFETELRDTARAVENYRAALTGDPDNAEAVAALERFLDDADHRVEAAEVLEPVYAGRHDWKALIRIYEIRLEATDEPQKRLQLTRRIARLFEDQLEDLDGAFRWYGRLFREAPDDRGVREQLGRLANILGAHAKMAEIYEEWLKDVYEETPASLEVARTLAAIYDSRLHEPDKAKVCYQRLLAHDPNDAQAFQLLEASLTRAQKWTDLLAVYRDAVDNAGDAKKRKGLLLKICQLQRHALADRDAAIDTYREVLEVDPEDASAIGVLDELYTEGERWVDLVELLTRQLDRADTLERAALKLRLGRLQEEKLAELDAAVDAFQEVLSVDPDSADALAALERLILHKDVRLRIAEILEPIYQAQDEWAKLVVIYDAQLEFIDDKIRRVELLREIARLQAERGGNMRLAFKALGRAWSEEATEGPDREEPLYESLIDFALQLGNWTDLIAILREAVENNDDDELRARTWARIAEIQEQRQRDLPAAIESWRKVTALRDEEVRAWKALERLLASQDRPAQLVDVLEKRLSLSSDLREQKALAYRAADLYERVLARPDQAIAIWRQVLTLDEEDHPALGALERLYGARAAWRDLAWVYSRQIELADTDLERRPLWFSLAETQEKAGEVREAITAWKGALDENPGDPEALAALLRLYEQESMWPELLETLDLAASVSAEDEERQRFQFRAAKVLEEKQGEALGAIDRYRQILDENAHHAGAREALEALLRAEDTREAAAGVLEPLYQRTGEWKPLVAVLERRLGAESDGGSRRALLARIAELHELGLDDAPAAFGTWGRLLVDEPADSQAHGELERLAAQLGRWGELAAVYKERLDAVFDPDVQRLLSMKLAAIHDERLADAQRAISYYRKALELPGEELPALLALDRLLGRELATAPTGGRGKAARELADILEREAAALQEPDAQADAWFRLGELRHEHLDETDDALRAWREAIERAPQHGSARIALELLLDSAAHAAAVLDLLEPLYDADRDHEKRVSLAEKRLTLTKAAPDRAALLSRIAAIHENETLDLARALDAAARALSETPGEPQLADEIERIGGKAGLLANAAAALERVLAAGVKADVAREIGLRAARLFEQIGEEARAEARYLAVVESDPENGDALAALERIYRGRNDSARLADALEKRSAIALDPNDRKALLSEVALLREGPLADEPGAVKAWQQVLAIDEADGYALAALASLHEAAARWNELVNVLEQQARFAPDPTDQANLKARVASLWAEKLANPERAVDAWREVLDLTPGSMSALTAVEELQTKRGDWKAVQDILVQQLSVVSAGPEQVPVYRRLAAVALEKLNEPDEAVGYLQSILDLQPEDGEAIDKLEQVFQKQGRWYDLVDLLRKHSDLAASLGERDLEVKLLVRAADVMEEKLDDSMGATELLEMILARDPRNVRALGSLAKIYEAAQDLERCKETLEKAAALGGTGDDAAQIQFRLGRIEDQLRGPGSGETYYQAALELDPTHAGALQALEELARQRGQWSKVAELLTLRAELSEEGVQRPLWLELAKLHTERLRRPDDAVAALERARALAPSDSSILEPLADGYFNAGRFDRALPIYQALIDSTLAANKGRKTKELARLHFRVGGVAEKLGDANKAMEQYNAAYAIDAGHPPTLAAIGRLAMAAADWEKARRVFRSLLLQNLDPASGVKKADVYLALGEIHEKTNEAPKAVGMYERGLELEPSSDRLKEALARAKAAR